MNVHSNYLYAKGYITMLVLALCHSIWTDTVPMQLNHYNSIINCGINIVTQFTIIQGGTLLFINFTFDKCHFALWKGTY